MRQHLRLLVDLEQTQTDTHVNRVFAFKVAGTPATGSGVGLRVTDGQQLIAPPPEDNAKPGQPQAAEEGVGSDSGEDDIEHGDIDVVSSDCAVDTGSEDDLSSDASSEE